MVKLINFDISNSKDYIDMYKEWQDSNTNLIPDVLEIACYTEEDYIQVLEELKNRSNGLHADIDWYEKSYYFLATDENDKIIGIGCIRYNLTKLGYDVWGHIAYGVRPSARRNGYATEIAKELLKKCRELNMDEVIMCHYIDNEISPKIFEKIGAKYSNSIISEHTNKEIKRYVYDLKNE